MEKPTPAEPKKCGIVMPISSIDGCDETHWTEVRAILADAIKSSGFDPNLVSDGDDIGIIQKRIIQNLYENPVVVCDVSGKNPNVMFELGIRLAFDKPTIIVKDNKTSYSFDTSPIEHLEYPRDLRFSKIVDFKESLAAKINATYSAANNDPNYTTFLKHFGTFTVAKIEEKEVTGNELVISEIHELREIVMAFSRRVPRNDYDTNFNNSTSTLVSLGDMGLSFPEIRRAIDTYKHEHNLNRKTDIRRERKSICNYVQKEINPNNPEEFRYHFNKVFDELYN